MNQFDTLLRTLEEELKTQRELLKLLNREKQAVADCDQTVIDELSGTKTKALTRAIELGASRENLVREITNLSDRKRVAKISEAILKCTETKLKKQLNSVVSELKILSKEVKAINTYNAALISQGLGVLTSSLAIIKSSPGSELPTYGVKGELKSKSSDSSVTSRRALVTSA